MIHLVLPDDEAGRALAHGLKLAGLALEAESDSSPQLASVDKRMKHALDCLKQENLLVHGYDYVWIMRYIRIKMMKIKLLLFIYLISYSYYFISFMYHIQLSGVSTLSQYDKCCVGRFPDWTFTDTKDATERLRRVNLVKRFVAIFIKGH